MNGLSVGELCCLFCCPPCPSKIVAKLAFLPPQPTYKLIKNEDQTIYPPPPSEQTSLHNNSSAANNNRNASSSNTNNANGNVFTNLINVFLACVCVRVCVHLCFCLLRLNNPCRKKKSQ